MADTDDNVVNLEPGNLPALKRGEKVGQGLMFSSGGTVQPRNFPELIEYAQMMCKADKAIPAHLRNNPGACMVIIQRARKWDVDEYFLADQSYFVNDRLAFQAQVFSAVIKKWAPVKEKVWNPTYSGEGQSRKVSFKLHHRETNEEVTYESPTIANIAVKNSPLWKSEPDQQLYYYGIRALARRHFSEILLGAYDREEAAGMRDITPESRDNKLFDGEQEPLGDNIDPITGEDHNHAAETVDAETGEITLDKMIEDNQVPLKSEEPILGDAWDGPGKRLTIEELEKEPLTEELIVTNMLKSIGRTESNAALAEYKRLTGDDVKKMTADNRKKIRAAFFDREGGFDEL